MEYRKLGKSGLQVSEMSLGCWVMGGDYWGGADDSESINAIRAALEMGVNHLDTAELYGNGRSEEVVGKAIKGYPRDKVYVASKVWKSHLAKNDVKKACEDTLKRLGTDYLDIYFIHYPHETIPLEETMEAMVRLKEEGLIRVIGVSNYSKEQIKRVMKIGRVDVIQPCYSLLWRFVEGDILPYCIENEIGVVGYSPLAQGILTGKFSRGYEFKEGDSRPNVPLFRPGRFEQCIEVAESLKPFAEKYGKTQGQIAINWANSQIGITSSIVGARNPKQVEENVGACGWRMSDEDIKAIDLIGRKVTDTLPEFETFFSNNIIKK